MRIVKESRKSLVLKREGDEIVLRAPYFCLDSKIESFLKKHKSWINSQKERIKEDKEFYYLFGKRYKKEGDETWFLKKKAKEYIIPRVFELALKFKVEFNDVKITSAKRRWGSCSSKKNLNFSYRCIALPKEVIDYIIIHELTHLTYFNHSKDFWNLVEKRCKNYKELEKILKEFA